MYRIVYYETDDQRKAYVKQAEDNGEVMVHDDFGTGPDGKNTLTFETPEPDIPRVSTELQRLGRRFVENPQSISHGDIVRYVGLKHEGASD